MATKRMTDEELWAALTALDDDLLNPVYPEAAIDEELEKMGVDPTALALRGAEFVAKAKEDERLSWQARAQERKVRLQAIASQATSKLPALMGRAAILAKLDQLRTADPNVGTAVTMAARKRKPEESTDEELRTLLEEMEALRAIEGQDED